LGINGETKQITGVNLILVVASCDGLINVWSWHVTVMHFLELAKNDGTSTSFVGLEI